MFRFHSIVLPSSPNPHLIPVPFFLRRSLSSRPRVALEEKILKALSSVTDPTNQNKSIRNLNYIKTIDHHDGGGFTVNLRLPSRFHPYRRKIIDDANLVVGKLKDLYSDSSPTPPANIVITYDTKESNTGLSDAHAPPPLAGAKNNLKGPGLAHTLSTLAVYSCKGGVGKSTVATNLAYTLSSYPHNLRVGLLDCDVHGPSLPTLINPVDKTVWRSAIGKGMIKPIDHHNVKVMSLGYVSPSSGVPGSGASSANNNDTSAPAIIRGPMASKVVTQLLKGTEWGNLDILLLDLPPGTGDIQLTVCQELTLDGAIAVTTPGKLSHVDVIKGVEMFKKLGVPTLVGVENMAYFVNPVNQKRHYLLGKGVEFARDLGIDNDSEIVKIPMSEIIAEANDCAVPLMLTSATYDSDSESAIAKSKSDSDSESDSEKGSSKNSDEFVAYKKLADIIIKQLYVIHQKGGKTDEFVHSKPSLDSVTEETLITTKIDMNSVTFKYDNARKSFVLRIFTTTGAREIIIDPVNLRTRHPRSGLTITIDDKQLKRMLPIKVCERKGNYGYSVTWGNGDTIIYGMDCILMFEGEGGRLEEKGTKSFPY